MEKYDIAYRLLYEQMAEGLCIGEVIFDNQGNPIDHKILDVNSAYEKQTGLTREQAVGKRASDYDIEEVWTRRYGEAVQTRSPIQFEEYFSFTHRWYDVEVYPLDADNQFAAIFIDISSRKLQEQELRTRLEKYSNAAEIKEGYLVYQLKLDQSGTAVDYTIIEANDAVEFHCGLSPQQLIGKKFSSFLPILQEAWLERFSEVASSGIPMRFEEFGSVTNRWLDIYAYPLSKDKVAVLFNDITQQRTAIDELRESSEKYKAIFNAMDEGFCVIDMVFDENMKPVDYRFLESNPAFEKFTGFCNANGKLISEVLPGLEDHWFQMYGKVALTGEPVRFTNVAEKMNRWFDVGAFKIGGKESNKVALLFRDVTKRKGNAEKIRQQNTILQAINKVYEVAIKGEGLQQLRQACLDIAQEATGSKLGFLAVKNDRGLIDIDIISDAGLQNCNLPESKTLPDNLPAHGLYGMVIETGKSILTNSPSTHPLSKGLPPGHSPISAFLGAPLLREGRVSGMIGLGNKEGGYLPHDQVILEAIAPSILEVLLRKQAEEELIEKKEEYRILVEELETANHHKNEFLGVLSHELRNPLASVTMALSLLKKTPPGSREADQAIDIIQRQTSHLSRMIDDLLDLTRVNRGKIDLQKVNVDFCDVVKEAVTDYKSQFAQKGVELQVNIDSHGIQVDADPVRLTQIVGNLLHNALKFTPTGGKAAVNISKQNGEAVLSVQDNGIGIEPHVADKLFLPFEQVENTLDRNKGGLGLGLFLVHQLVALHDGAVKVESEGLGKGVKFTIHFPVTETVSDSPCNKERGNQSPSLRVLVIDDNKDVANVLKALLEHFGHQVEVAHEGLGGLARAREFLPQVVICDIGLPGISGYEVAKQIKLDELAGNPYLISLTGYARPEDVANAKEAGFDEHLAKPVDMKVLAETLMRAEEMGN